MAQQAAHSCDLDAFFVSGDGAADFTDDEREEQQEKKERRAAEAKKRNEERQRTKEKLKTPQKVKSSTVTSTSASSTGWDDETPPTDLTHVTIQPPQPPALMAQQMPSKAPSPSIRQSARRNVAMSNVPSQQQSAFSAAEAFPGSAPSGTRSTSNIPASARWGEYNQGNRKTLETDARNPNSDTSSIASAAISSGTAANVLPQTDEATAMTSLTPSNDNSKDAPTISIVQSLERLDVASHARSSKDSVDVQTSHDASSSQDQPLFLSCNSNTDTATDKMATLLSNFGIQPTPSLICLGIISAVESPESVFIRLWHQRNDLQTLSAELEAYYQANESELLNENVSLEFGTPLLLALAPDDVYRCVVVSEAELRPFDEVDARERSFNVFLVDQGCEVRASEAQLFALPDRFWSRPPFAFRCIFAEIVGSPKWRTGAYRYAFCHLLDTHYVKTELPVICQFQPRSGEAGENANSRQFAVQLYDTITDGCTVLQVLEQKGGL